MDIEHMAINVAEPVAMAKWYVEHLGMNIIRQVDGPPHTRFLADAAGRVVIEIYHQTVASVPDYASMHPMMLHIAFAPANVKEAHAKLLAAGAQCAGPPATTESGDEMAMVRDPWGVCVQLVKRAQPMM